MLVAHPLSKRIVHGDPDEGGSEGGSVRAGEVGKLLGCGRQAYRLRTGEDAISGGRGNMIGTALGGMVLAIAVSHRSVLGAVAAAVTLPVGLLAVTRVGDAERGPAPPGAAVFHRGTYAFVPMVALATAGMYHAVRHGEFTVVSVAAGSVAGFALTAILNALAFAALVIAYLLEA